MSHTLRHPPRVITPDPHRTARSIRRAIATGTLSDDIFDRVLAPRWQVRSAVHWTPVAVAEIAIQWLTGGGAQRVLDVGAGAGKLCVLGALLMRDVTFVGIERRPALVAEARRVARLLGVSDRAEIRQGSLDSVDGAEFDAFYLYNPFAESLTDDGDDDRIDDDVATGVGPFTSNVQRVQAWLRDARDETRLVTLHGFGGAVPLSYRRIARLPVGLDALAAWEQTGPPRRAHSVEPRAPQLLALPGGEATKGSP